MEPRRLTQCSTDAQRGSGIEMRQGMPIDDGSSTTRQCARCGLVFEEVTPRSWWRSLLADPVLRRSLADLVIRCPGCGSHLDRSLTFFRFARAGHVKGFLIAFILGMLIVAVYLSVSER
jgi:uncharacterized C2H2 Zn-finger protein